MKMAEKPCYKLRTRDVPQLSFLAELAIEGAPPPGNFEVKHVLNSRIDDSRLPEDFYVLKKATRVVVPPSELRKVVRVLSRIDLHFLLPDNFDLALMPSFLEFEFGSGALRLHDPNAIFSFAENTFVFPESCETFFSTTTHAILPFQNEEFKFHPNIYHSDPEAGISFQHARGCSSEIVLDSSALTPFVLPPNERVFHQELKFSAFKHDYFPVPENINLEDSTQVFWFGIDPREKELVIKLTAQAGTSDVVRITNLCVSHFFAPPLVDSQVRTSTWSGWAQKAVSHAMEALEMVDVRMRLSEPFTLHGRAEDAGVGEVRRLKKARNA